MAHGFGIGKNKQERIGVFSSEFTQAQARSFEDRHSSFVIRHSSFFTVHNPDLFYAGQFSVGYKREGYNPETHLWGITYVIF